MPFHGQKAVLLAFDKIDASTAEGGNFAVGQYLGFSSAKIWYPATLVAVAFYSLPLVCFCDDFTVEGRGGVGHLEGLVLIY